MNKIGQTTKLVQSRVFSSTERLVKAVENVVGIVEVRNAQSDVLKVCFLLVFLISYHNLPPFIPLCLN